MLIKTDKKGIWTLGDMPWFVFNNMDLPKEYRDLIYGALCKLKDYEALGFSPTELEHALFEYIPGTRVYDEDLGEDKQAICDRLCAALQLTRGAYDLQSIEYTTYPENGEEEACILFDNGHSVVVDVTADSGAAMIRDIMKHI